MLNFEWIGDGEYQSSEEKEKSQSVILESGSTYYDAYGDVRDEMLNSKGGNDVIIGAEGAIYNTFFGDSNIILYSKGGNDWLIGSDDAEINRLYGDSYLSSESKCGNDVLIGGANVNRNELYGDARTMEGNQQDISIGGNDVLIGGFGVMYGFFYGDAYYVSDTLCGNDLLIAGDSATENFMYGDGVLAYENARGGNDRLISGTGTDSMWGDFRVSGTDTKFGHDTFVFKENSGQDQIVDFRSGEDKIEICGVEGLTDFSQLQIAVQAGSSVITLGTDDIVTVTGVTNLRAQDFIFS